MKLLITVMLVVSFGSSALAESKGICEEFSYGYVKVLENKLLDDIGVIQGYDEDVSVQKKQKKVDGYYDNNFEMSYTFFITGNNDEGDWWTSKYEVVSQAFYDNGDSPQCYLGTMNYLGIVESGNHYEDDQVYTLKDLKEEARWALVDNCGVSISKEEVKAASIEDVDEAEDYTTYEVDFFDKGSVAISIIGIDKQEVYIEEYFCKE